VAPSPGTDEAERLAVVDAAGMDAYRTGPVSRDVGIGWALFAATYVGITGSINLLWGVTALSKKSHFDEGGLVWLQLDTWGWIAIIVAGLQLLTATVLYLRRSAGVFLGLSLASLTILLHFLVFGAYPGWSAAALVGTALVIWALTVHGDQLAR
jgi:hypothetical protein